MAVDKAKVMAVVNALKQEAELTAGVLREKGAKRFQKAFVLSGALVVASYLLVYSPPQKRGAQLAAQIEAAKAKSAFGGQYKDLSDRLGQAYKILPAESDREQWLSNSVRDSLSAGGLVTEDFKPVREVEQSGLVFQVSLVSVNLKFSEFYDWLLRIEGAQPLMHLQSLEFSKKTEPLGMNSATVEVATVVPKTRYQ